ncbi:hypothetical protein [Shewanella atlantica]|uniref:Cytochrome C n=1 Tax=Shewanella atlantica TaxID=271099 RepID=A0A3S0IGR1_9GAMM|nr:hypothetical protein [Shewanella atlantica]RTR33581.1 hypothetical protein EKG39_07625 [Shewanella atlantica]
MNKKLALAVSFALGLSACGSDDNTSTPPPVEPPPTINPVWEYVETGYMEMGQATLSGNINVAFDYMNEQVWKWIRGITKDSSQFCMNLPESVTHPCNTDVNGDGFVNALDANLAGVLNKQTEILSIDTAEIHKVLATNPDGLGAGTARPDIFKEGSLSAFDLLRYMVATRDDMKFIGEVITPNQSAYDTHEFTLGYDRNGNGNFTDEGEQSRNWHYRFTQSMGEAGLYRDHSGEISYTRMDNFLIKEEQRIRFQDTSTAFISRLHYIWQQEIEKLAANNGKVIVDNVYWKDDPENSIATNIEVKPHNLRSDVFQDGVITRMDLFLTLADMGHDFRLNWWPKLETGAIVNSFSLSRAPVLGKTIGLRSFTTKHSVISDVDGDLFFSDRMPGICNFDAETGRSDVINTPVAMTDCVQDFWSAFGIGGWFGNINNDLWTMPYGADFVELTKTDLNNAGYHSAGAKIDSISKYDIIEWDYNWRQNALADKGVKDEYINTDIVTLRSFKPATKQGENGKAPLLDETHFGWKVADCTQCHNDEKDPKGHGGYSWPVNAADGFNETQPYYCSTCHGNNGAPAGHGREARCFWCHSEDMLPKNHGEASARKLLKHEDNWINTITTRRKAGIDNNYYGFSNNHNEILEGDQKGYGDRWVSSNNDYDFSKKFPDPFACGTCHQDIVKDN